MKALTQSLGAALGLLIVVGLCLLAASIPVHAAVQCGRFSVIAEQLADKWQEAVRGRGLARQGNYIVTLFHDPEGDSWTIVGVQPDGTACILGSGTGWETIAPAPAGTEG